MLRFIPFALALFLLVPSVSATPTTQDPCTIQVGGDLDGRLILNCLLAGGQVCISIPGGLLPDKICSKTYCMDFMAINETLLLNTPQPITGRIPEFAINAQTLVVGTDPETRLTGVGILYVSVSYGSMLSCKEDDGLAWVPLMSR